MENLVTLYKSTFAVCRSLSNYFNYLSIFSSSNHAKRRKNMYSTCSLFALFFYRNNIGVYIIFYSGR